MNHDSASAHFAGSYRGRTGTRPKQIIGISGGTCSGKTTLAVALQATLNCESAIVLSTDSYYLAPNPSLVNCGKVNFDHPFAMELSLLREHLGSLVKGDSISSPIYDRRHSKRTGNQLVASAQIIIVEGLFALWDEEVRDSLTLKVFLDTDADIRLGRRVLRDTIEYEIDLKEVYQNYLDVARPMHQQFTEPAKQHADLILKWPISITDEVSSVIKALGRSMNRI